MVYAVSRIPRHVGERVTEKARTFYDMTGLFYDTVTSLLFGAGKRKISLKEVVDQVLFTGVDAFGIVGLIGLLCGVTIAVQGMNNMSQIGAGEYFGKLMVIAVVRELGPFFTSLVVIGRSGAALAAYIGNMRVNKEIAALEVMGIDLTGHLVVPAFVGMILSLICLNIYFDLIAIVGGLLVAKVTVLTPFRAFLGRVIGALSWMDILLTVLKNLLFGAVIATVSCYHGLAVTSVRIVPRAVFRAVVGSMIVTMLLNVFITIACVALGVYAK